jgi:hypothetical protein
MEQLLPVLGQDFLIPISKPGAPLLTTNRLFCDIKDVRASGRRTDNGFVVFAGSEAVLEERPSTQKWPYAATLRSQLLADGILEKGSHKLVFKQDYEFSSPSAAASVIQGGQANGMQAWKDADGISLKDREERELPIEASEAASPPATYEH